MSAVALAPLFWTNGSVLDSQVSYNTSDNSDSLTVFAGIAPWASYVKTFEDAYMYIFPIRVDRDSGED